MTVISTWGAHAERFVARHASARVVALFSRSLHLEADGDFLCLGDASIGRGPLNAIMAAEDWARLAGSVPEAGGVAVVGRRAIGIGGTAIDTSCARPWRPAPWPPAIGRARQLEVVERLVHLARDRAPADGLARMVLAPAAEPCSTLERIARPRIERLRAWVAIGPSAAARGRPPVDLLGLGPGLTPSGDDLLCGALLALHAVEGTAMAAGLSREIAATAPAATSPLSAAFLRAAAEGLGSEPVHTAIAAVLGGRVEALASRLEAVGRIGHTSGWDALAGALLVLQAFGTTAVQRPWVAQRGISE